MSHSENTLPPREDRYFEAWSSTVSADLKRSAGMSLGLVFTSALGFYVLAGHKLSFEGIVVAGAALFLVLVFSLGVYALPSLNRRHFGAANTITAIRAAMICMIGSTILFSQKLHASPQLTWALIGVILLALTLDGVDGYIARRLKQESRFGARFDMELDALLVLFLAIAVWSLGKAGFWVLLIGAMRYLFVFALAIAPSLKGDLPESFRRKIVCVLQIAGLCLALSPVVTPPLSTLISAAALVMLSYSFALDSAYLWRHRDQSS